MTPHAHHGRRVEAAVALLTVSDTRNVDNDDSGSMARRLVEQAGHRIADYRIVPDDPQRIESTLSAWLAQEAIDAIVISGGTGISARDRTVETIRPMLDLELDGFGELFRLLSHRQIGSAAMLSRATAGIARGKPLFALPGSTAAVELALNELVLPELSHLLRELEK